MEQFLGEAILALAGLVIGVGYALVRRIDGKNAALGKRLDEAKKEIGERIGAGEDKENDTAKRVAVMEHKVVTLEKQTENNACKEDIRELKVDLMKRIDDLAAEIKERRK